MLQIGVTPAANEHFPSYRLQQYPADSGSGDICEKQTKKIMGLKT